MSERRSARVAPGRWRQTCKHDVPPAFTPGRLFCSARGDLSSLAILSQLACDSFKRASNSLVSADKPPQESEGVYDDGYDASDVNQNEQSPK
jgi:hypothetical protein